MSTNEMNFKVKELRELRRMREELDAEIAAAEDSIKAEMQERNVEELAAGKYIIRWTSVISNRFDSSAFKKVHADLYKAFCKATESRRFSISA